MLFTDDNVLVDETRKGVNAKLEWWRKDLDSQELKLSQSKMKYIKCNFSLTRDTI